MSQRRFSFNLSAGSLLAAAAFVLSAATPGMAGSIGTGSFNLWQSCSTKASISGGIITVPEGGTECSSNFVGAQEKSSQSATGMSFYGSFVGGSGAPNSAQEMAVFVADNVSSWNGHEMGFLKTLNDNTTKAYIQGGGHYYYQVVQTGNAGNHTYKCQVQSGNHSAVDFYVDGAYKCTLTNSGQNYWGNQYWFVGTTHRTQGGWSQGSDKITMSSMTTY